MKKYFILLVVPFLMLAACMEDTSAYLPQDKEDVNVDKPTDGGGDPTPPAADALIPGVQAVTLSIPTNDGKVLERKFKYFMPVSIDKNKPIPLIFELHGSYEYQGDIPTNPIQNISPNHTLNQHAVKENCIVVFPAGLPSIGTDKNFVNWTDKENNLKFIDAMLDYFKSMKPLYDATRVYSTGQSSGAIFSFVLAFERPNVFAAIAPRAGQMALKGDEIIPDHAVPIRAFNGMTDDIVNHDAAVKNIIVWSEKVGGYFINDMQYNVADTLEIPGYKKYLTRTWTGGKADIQLISLIEEGHGIALDKVLPMMWEFLSAHKLNTSSVNLFISASEREIIADENETYDIKLNYTPGATFSYTITDDWNAELIGNTLKVTAPSDFYSSISKGEIVLKATINGMDAIRRIPLELKVPKQYFEVGDIYYNSNREAIGVVVSVNMKNKREARILNLEEVPGTYGTINYGKFGSDFYTPNLEDGEINTTLSMKQKVDNNLNLTSTSSGLVWAAEYSYKGVSGWYLPASNELKALDKILTTLNPIIESIGGRRIKPTKASDGGYMSSTVTPNGATNKEFHIFNFYSHVLVNQIVSTDNTAYWRARAMKKVTK